MEGGVLSPQIFLKCGVNVKEDLLEEAGESIIG